MQGAGGLKIYRLSVVHSRAPPQTNNLSRLKGEMFLQGVQNIYSLLVIHYCSKGIKYTPTNLSNCIYSIYVFVILFDIYM